MERTESRYNKFRVGQKIDSDYINCLPPEMIFKILTYLDVQSLCKIKMTCKYLKEIAEEDELWRRHCQAQKAICPSEIAEDQAQGYTWQVNIAEDFIHIQGNENKHLDTDVTDITTFKDNILHNTNAYFLMETLRRNYSKSMIKQQWLEGRLSNIASYSELPTTNMCPMSASSWGDILDAELTRDKQRHI
ncbi:F-box only protein 48 [Pseudophryne corroboree]|uniref:F-box only protein 48 n=1 Tax=Pseudophryne corroboree TaxID=495146 RepID=UPI0030813E8F